jgi:Pvc16 N-terminal domain
MARYPAVAATSDAILGLLQTAAIGSEFAGISFAHYQAKNLDKPMNQGIALLLYRVNVSANRNLPPRLRNDGKRYRPPLPLDLHYLLIPWADDTIKQQRLLGWAIRTLEDTPILPAGILNQHGPEPDTFGPGETVELVWENLSQQDTTNIWDAAKAKEQPSAAYVARYVEIESEIPLTEAPLVQTRELDYADMTT